MLVFKSCWILLLYFANIWNRKQWDLAVYTTYLIPPANWNTDKLSEVTKTWLHKVCTINHYLLGAAVIKWLSSKPCQFVKKYFSASNFVMHVFRMSVTHLQSAEKIQWNLAVSTTYLIPPTYCLTKNTFSASNFFMYIFNMSVTYLQSVEKI